MQYNFSKCIVDFTECQPTQRLIDFHPALSAFNEFKNASDENYIRIAIATADPESPFVKIKERDLMLIALFEFLGIETKTNRGKSFFNDVFLYQHTGVLECFSAYLKVCHDIDWTEYQTTKQTYDVLVNEANRPRDKEEGIDSFVKRRINIQNHLKSIGIELKRIEAKIFPDSKAAREVALLEARKIHTWAERYAESNTYV